MDREILRELRNKIPVTLKEAIELLKENGGNIKASEENYQTFRILEICNEAECTIEKARVYYKRFNSDKAKAIREINNEQLVLTTGESKISKNAIGFILWLEDKNGKPYLTKKRNDIFIPTKDFDYVLKEFKSICSETFDITGRNYFNRAECQLLLKKTSEIEIEEKSVKNFLKDLNNWIFENLNNSEILVVYGNL